MATVTLGGKPCRTNGEWPEANEKMPDFQLVDQRLKNKTLSSFDGKAKFVYTVPSLDTETCAKSTQKLNELFAVHEDIVFLLVSADLPFAQQRFCREHALKATRTLSMMRGKQFADDYGVLLMDGPLQGLTARAVMLANTDNEIIYSKLIAEIADEPDYAVIAAAIKTL